MTDFQPGEVVDITIKGARVTNTYPTQRGYSDGNYVDTGTVLVVRLDEAPTDDRNIAVNLAAPGVTVERVVPAEWPPRPDDLWRHAEGALFFATAVGSNVVLINSTGHMWDQPRATEERHRMTLVYREGDAKPCGCDHHGDHAGCDADCECAS